MNVVAMWSGGKDSYLAYHETISKGFKVLSLFNYVFKNVERPTPYKVLSLFNYVFKNVGRTTPSRVLSLLNFANKNVAGNISHEIAPEIIAIQAQAMEMPLVQWTVTLETFEDQFKAMIRTLEPTVIEGVVWGVEEGGEVDVHRDRLHKVCDELGIKLILPLHGISEEQILAYFMEKGFEAIIIVIDSNLLSEEWLGRKVDHKFLREIRRLSLERGIPSGNIEYHTLVTDAPLLKRRLKVLKSRKVSKNGYSVLEISKVELVEKTDTFKDENS
jgi:diphthine-ammonia ligase